MIFDDETIDIAMIHYTEFELSMYCITNVVERQRSFCMPHCRLVWYVRDNGMNRRTRQEYVAILNNLNFWFFGPPLSPILCSNLRSIPQPK